MRVVEPSGSLPWSVSPSRSWVNGAAMASISARETSASSFGRRSSSRDQRAQPAAPGVPVSPRPSCARSRRGSTRSPKKPSSAGSSVSEASTVVATLSDAATATPYRNDRPRANSPSRAMQTVMPANSTARPEVSTAVTDRLLRRAALEQARCGSG